jgi:alpha-tubulin suppressor-like RCC1 family protein
VQRSDGSIWFYGLPTAVTNADSSLFIATSFSSWVSGYCGVESDGSVWCGTFSGTTNTDGVLGNGTTTGSTTPSQVVTGTGGPALTGITKVFSGADGYTSCAINASGSLWCWGFGGYGLLGNGYTANSTFAVPVLSASGGAQFTGVDSLAISEDHICAVTTGHALYCWGSNGSGQAGVGTATAQYLYPAPVTALSSNVANVTVSTAFASGTCATTTAGDVWCWGANGSGQLGAGTTSASSNVPVLVLSAADGGAPLSGVSHVQFYEGGNYVIAQKAADGSLWTWGGGSTVPAPYTESGSPVTAVFMLAESPGTSANPQFIASDGTFHMSAHPATSPPCP